jgi:hypothetical protein
MGKRIVAVALGQLAGSIAWTLIWSRMPLRQRMTDELAMKIAKELMTPTEPRGGLT